MPDKTAADFTVMQHPRPVAAFGLRRHFDGLVLAVCRRALRRAEGCLLLTLPSGASAAIGTARRGHDAQLRLKSYSLFWRALKRGSIGVAECYMADAFETDNLNALFHYYLDNRAALAKAGRGRFRVRRRDRDYHARRANTRSGSRRNIAEHYDLGNDFYKVWLDPGMTYSSALYTAPDMPLEAAQAAKYGRIVDALGLTRGQRVLEIGCGWGGFAEVAARAGGQVKGITLSLEQHAWTTGRLGAAGLAANADIVIEDYRDTAGTFDRIASIEMIEAVGEENWPAYFKVLHDRLAPGGVAVIQAITIEEKNFDAYRQKADFIQRYIFPGGMLLTEAVIAEQARAAGLSYERIETFAGSYVRTLAEWRTRFHAGWPTIQALGFDDRFRRMWDYYFTYCEVGFARGTIDVGLYRLSRPAGATGAADHGA